MRMPPVRPRLSSPGVASIAILFVVAAGTTACKSARERAEEQAAARRAAAQLTISDAGLTMTLEGGVFSLGAGTKLPDDFPKSVPVYPGSHIQMAARSPGAQGKPAWSLSLETQDPGTSVIAFYKAHMAGFTQASALAMGDTQMAVWQSAQLDVTLMVSSSAGGAESDGPTGATALTMTVSSK